MLHEVVRLAGRGVATFFASLAFLILGLLILGLTFTAAMKLIFPDLVGLWVGRDLVVMGLTTSDEVREAQELLGYWIIPVNLILALLFYRMLAALLRWFLRARARALGG